MISHLSCTEKAPQGRRHLQPVLCRKEGGTPFYVNRIQAITVDIHNLVKYVTIQSQSMRLISEEGGSGRKLIEKKNVNSKGTALQLLCREICHYEKEVICSEKV